MKNYFALSVFLFSLTALCGCQPQGPAQRAGARTDEVIDNVKHGEDPLKKKGVLEKAGESIDNTVNGSNQ